LRFYLINRYFWPDESATAMLLTDLAEDLAARGHEVNVLSSRQLYNNPRARLPAYQTWHGVQIHRLFSTSFGRRSFAGRLFDVLSFRWSLSAATNLQRPEAWFVMTDPPFILEQVLKLRHKLGGRIIHHVDDVYPDLAVSLAAIPRSGAFKTWLQRRAVRSLFACDGILALGDCMVDVLKAKGLPSESVAVVPPWADGREVRPVPHQENAFRREIGLSPSDFVVMYSGNMGQGHRFETIMQAATLLDTDGDIHHIFVGDGAKKGEIERQCAQNSLRNFRLLPFQPRKRLKETLSAGDAHLISLDSSVQGLIVPSKLAGILAVGRPIIFVGETKNSVARAVLQGKCGFVVPEGDGFQLQSLVMGLKKDPEKCKLLGKRARELFEGEYNRSVVVPRIIACLEGQKG
jgi:colanic acid biosynthesis glycosyl transferase WcaI